MLHWSAVLFVVALIVGILGFGRLSAAAAAIAPVPFFVFVLSCAVAVAVGWHERRMPASTGADAENRANDRPRGRAVPRPAVSRFRAPLASS